MMTNHFLIFIIISRATRWYIRLQHAAILMERSWQNYWRWRRWKGIPCSTYRDVIMTVS